MKSHRPWAHSSMGRRGPARILLLLLGCRQRTEDTFLYIALCPLISYPRGTPRVRHVLTTHAYQMGLHFSRDTRTAHQPPEKATCPSDPHKEASWCHMGLGWDKPHLPFPSALVSFLAYLEAGLISNLHTGWP